MQLQTENDLENVDSSDKLDEYEKLLTIREEVKFECKWG